MKRYLKIIFIFIIPISCCITCGFKKNSIENYKESIDGVLNPLSGKIKEQQDIYNYRDIRGCHILIKNYWENDGSNQVWVDGDINIHTGISLDTKSLPKTNSLISDPLHHLIYIGPWYFSKTIGKEIRFYAYTGKNGGYIMYQFESKNDQNKNIPEKPFSMPKNEKNNPPKFELCVTKWIANYGYNAISEVKSKNPFSKNYLVPTGKIIQVEE